MSEQTKGGFVADTPTTLSTVANVSPELIRNEIDSRIVRVRPMSTPIDQITRHAESRRAGSMIVDYYSVDTRPAELKVSQFVEDESEPGKSEISIVFNEPESCVPKVSETLISPVAKNSKGENLVFYVFASDKKTCYVEVLNTDDETLLDPDDFNGKTLVRMGRAATELDVQTPLFQNVPTKASNFCQIFKSQIEQSTLVKLVNKEVGWSFSDQEEAAVIDMRMGMERNFLFGHKARFNEPNKNEDVFLTGGIWNQTDNEWSYKASEQFSPADFISLMRKAFTGNGGSSRKILIGGSEFIERFHAAGVNPVIRPDQMVNKWGIDFSLVHSKFGTLYVVLSEIFDQCGHAADGMVIDPEYLTKYTHIPFQSEVLNLRSSGVRNTDAIVLTEASCLVLRYPRAHMRIVAQ